MNTAEYLQSQKPDDKDMIVLEWVRTEFNLPPSILDQCDNFFLRVWDGAHVARSVFAGVLEHSNSEYIVHWQSSPAVVKASPRVACSFREYQMKKYVVIKVWNKEAS